MEGRPKQNVLVTKSVFEMIKTNYNMKTRYILNRPTVHPISIENPTLGVLVECLNGIVEAKRQYRVGKYYVATYKIAI